LRQYRRLAPALGLVVLLAALAGVGAWRFWPRQTLTPDYTPLIAVLPFTTLATDPEQSDFARNLTREVSAYLSTFAGARTLTISDPAAKLAPRDQARQSNATYLLEGDVAKAGEKTRIAVRLTDVATGESLWSDQYDFEGSDALGMQGETARKIYGALGGGYGAISKVELEKAWRKPDADLTDYDYSLRANSHYTPETREGLARVRQVAEEGLARFPDSPALNLHMANALLLEQIDLGPFADCHEKFALAWKYASAANKSKAMSRSVEFFGHVVMAKLYNLYAKDFDRSVEEAEAAMEIGPNSAVNRSALSTFLAVAGRTDRAIEWGSEALRLGHNAAFVRFLKPNFAWDLYVAGRYDEALETIKGNEMVTPDAAVAIYARLGRLGEAQSILAEWQKETRHSIATQACYAMKEPINSGYLDDLRKAGLPEK
jgi:TolB-like protein